MLTACDLEDKKPSQPLRHMKHLSSPYKTDEALLKQMWPQRLPHNVRSIPCVSGDSIALEALAGMADKIMVIYPNNHNVNMVQAAGRSDTSSIIIFQQQLNELPNKLASLQATTVVIPKREHELIFDDVIYFRRFSALCFNSDNHNRMFIISPL